MQVEEYIVDIIRTEMGLSQQNIWIQSQNRKIPPESQELYCVVGVTNFRPISSKSKFLSTDNNEQQIVYGRADVQVDLMSRSNEARNRRSEVLMALNSFYSKEQQDSKCFRIFELPTAFINTSGLQGGSDINRFTLIIPTMISEVKIKSAAYYDKFRATLQTERGAFAKANIEPYTFSINPVPDDASVLINNQAIRSIQLPAMSNIDWLVSKAGYVTQEGTETITSDKTLDIVLAEITKYTFTINPTPADAIVTINGEVRNSITAEENTLITWSVEAEGYISQSGEYTLTENYTLAVVLEENVPVWEDYTIPAATGATWGDGFSCGSNHVVTWSNPIYYAFDDKPSTFCRWDKISKGDTIDIWIKFPFPLKIYLLDVRWKYTGSDSAKWFTIDEAGGETLLTRKDYVPKEDAVECWGVKFQFVATSTTLGIVKIFISSLKEA